MQHTARWLFTLLLCGSVFMPIDSRTETTSSSETIPPVTENPLSVLPGLESAVDFWKRIFAEYSLSQMVFFDPLDMSKIYEVVDVGVENRPKSYVDGERARIAAVHGVDLERVRAQRGIKERTAEGLKRSGRLMAQMQQIFREKGLPVELTYLPLVESSFDSTARSHAGALGMWQFMRRTGKQFLRVDRQIDERRDPLESTRAAASLLDQNYQTLGNWPLAVTAYNYGAGGLSRAVAELATDDLVELIRQYKHPYWGFAAQNFYAEFLAAVEIAKNREQYFPELEIQPAVTIREIEVKKSSSIADLAKSTGLTRAELLGWNPALGSGVKTVPAGYRVKLPADRSMQPVIEVAQREAAERQSPQTQKVVRHRVKPGETVVHIARRYGASAEKILAVNGIRKAHLLRVGMTLLIPKL
ncbi:MAG TPA: transglycosylase SLT domain-containing protein [Candidatus Binatia bacterium]|nr:transglycosylase SLT domain-containing protein [Candidatus Binatia bacterium]